MTGFSIATGGVSMIANRLFRDSSRGRLRRGGAAGLRRYGRDGDMGRRLCLFDRNAWPAKPAMRIDDGGAAYGGERDAAPDEQGRSCRARRPREATRAVAAAPLGVHEPSISCREAPPSGNGPSNAGAAAARRAENLTSSFIGKPRTAPPRVRIDRKLGFPDP